MNILVVNGSPKGENSITLQTVLYLQKHFPKHTFSFLHRFFKAHGQYDFP